MVHKFVNIKNELQNDVLGNPEPTPMIMPTFTKKFESTTLHSQLVQSFVNNCIFYIYICMYMMSLQGAH